MPVSRPNQDRSATTRRTFLKAAGAAAVTAAVGPTILHATNKSGSRLPILGTGEFQYEPHHGWGHLPDHIVWGDTHGVAIDREGLIYIKHRSVAAEPMDAIVVFDSDGRYVRSFGKEFHGGGHGIDIRNEGGQEFLYLSDIKHGVVAKTTLKGETVWRIGRPQQPELYQDKKNRYSPTNVAFGPDGSLYVGDGYGSHFIHHYDRDARPIGVFGGKGKAAGKLSTPHGLWLDDRPGRQPSLIVADRANARLQYFTLDGEHLGFVNEVSFPADIDIRGQVMLVPELHARITLFDKENNVITHLGYDPEWTKKALERDGRGFKLRRHPEQWQTGRFVHPHDACFDHEGNIYVTEWVPTGRVSFLRKVS